MEKEIENLDSRMLENDVSKPDKEDFLLNAEVLIKKMEKGMRDDFIRTKDESDPNTTLISDIGPTTRKKGETVSMESKNELIIEEQRKTDLELEISNRKDNIELEWKERYLEALSEYQMYQKELKDIEKRKKILKTEQEKKLILNIHVQGILSGLSIIVTKIKNAAQSSHKIRGILEGQVKLDMTGERIHNSYDNNNVSGMYQALYDHYGKANFVTFTNDLLSTMSINIERDTAKSNPMKAVQKTEVIFATWEVMGYWRYMSKDIFWTGILLNSFPKSTGDNDIRDRLIFETNNFIRTHEPDERSTLDGEMPIYDHLRDYIKTIQDSMQMRTSRNYQGTSNNKTSSNMNNGTVFNNTVNRDPQLESAAGAETQLVTGGTKFDVEVTRDAGVFHYSDCGKKRSYTSTKRRCDICKNAKDSGNRSVHIPICYLGECGKCHNYGHKEDSCQQLPNTYRRSGKLSNEANNSTDGIKVSEEQVN